MDAESPLPAAAVIVAMFLMVLGFLDRLVVNASSKQIETGKQEFGIQCYVRKLLCQVSECY